MKGFWGHFWSGSNATVNTGAVLAAGAIILATPVIILAGACVIHHVFVLNKGLDGPVSNLLVAMLGAATGTVFGGAGALGVSMFSKTTFLTRDPGPGTRDFLAEPPLTPAKAPKMAD